MVNGQSETVEALNKLLRGGRIASVQKEFVTDGENAYWAFCVESLDGAAVSPGGKSGSGARERVDYKEVLSEADFAVFAKLRDLRKTFAEKEAIPAYSVFTNEQLAAMVTEKVSSLAGKERKGSNAKVEYCGLNGFSVSEWGQVGKDRPRRNGAPRKK